MGHKNSMDVNQAIEYIESMAGNPSEGLVEEIFLMVSRLTPLVNVDLLIKDEENRTLLTWRDDSYWEPGWHIPGGIIRFKELWETRIQAVAASELGASVRFNETPVAVRQPMAPHRDTRGHCVSLLFQCSLTSPPDDRLKYHTGEPRHGEWAWFDRCPNNLIAVHSAMYAPFI